MMPFYKKIDDISPITVMLLVGAGAFLALLPAWMNYDIISRDGAFQYVPAARLFIDGKFFEGLSQPQLPLFPLLIAAITKITGLNPELSGRIASFIAYILAAAGMFKLCELLFKNRGIALLAVLFLITNRQLVDRSIDCLKESLLICCIIWGNYLIIKGIAAAGKKKNYYFLGFLTLLIGTLFRSTALVFLCAWLVIWVFHRKEGIFIRTVLCCIPAFMVLIVWLINPELPIFRKSLQFGYFFVSSHGIMDMLNSGINALAKFFSTGNPAIILFGLYGLYHFRKDFYFYHICLVLMLFFLILVLWAFASDRYFLAPIIWIYPVAAYQVFRAFQSGFTSLKILAVLTVLSSIVLWGDFAFTPPDPDKLARKEAGQYILEQIGPDQEVITNRDRLAFYARANYKPLGNAGDMKNPFPVIAVDVEKDEGEKIKEHLEALGNKPDKVFRTIYVYLPKS